MPYFSNLQIPPPSHWSDFESLCCDLWRVIWEDPNTKNNGRQGQLQNGVDIYGRPHEGNLWSGIQCKCKNNDLNKNLTASEVEEEIQKAKSFVPRLSEFIIATTGPKDTKIEELARKITQEHLNEGLFSVNIWGWNDIKERLEDFPNVKDKHYPQENITLNDVERKGDESHFKRENAEKIIESVIRPLRKCAEDTKRVFENGDYITDLQSESMKLKLNFDGYEFIQICEKSNRFHIKNDNIDFIYRRDEILNKNMPQIISLLDNYGEHFMALKTIIESLNTSSIPTSFESDIAVLIKNNGETCQLIEDKRKEEFLFKVYATSITGKKIFGGHTWAVDLKRERTKDILDLIKKDTYSNEIFTKIESLKNEIILDIDELINELDNLDEELQNTYYL